MLSPDGAAPPCPPPLPPSPSPLAEGKVICPRARREPLRNSSQPSATRLQLSRSFCRRTKPPPRHRPRPLFLFLIFMLLFLSFFFFFSAFMYSFITTHTADHRVRPTGRQSRSAPRTRACSPNPTAPHRRSPRRAPRRTCDLLVGHAGQAEALGAVRLPHLAAAPRFALSPRGRGRRQQQQQQPRQGPVLSPPRSRHGAARKSRASASRRRRVPRLRGRRAGSPPTAQANFCEAGVRWVRTRTHARTAGAGERLLRPRASSAKGYRPPAENRNNNKK